MPSVQGGSGGAVKELRGAFVKDEVMMMMVDGEVVESERARREGSACSHAPTWRRRKHAGRGTTHLRRLSASQRDGRVLERWRAGF
jgi:hypothetical protein